MTTPHRPFVFRTVNDQAHAAPYGDAGPRLVAPGSTTQEDFGLFEIEISPGESTPSAHYHTSFSESFYVLDGHVHLRLGDDIQTAGPGDFAYVPRHGHHGFANATEHPARILILFSPGVAREDYFAEMIELHSRPNPPTSAEVDAVARRHDQINVHLDDQ